MNPRQNSVDQSYFRCNQHVNVRRYTQRGQLVANVPLSAGVNDPICAKYCNTPTIFR